MTYFVARPSLGVLTLVLTATLTSCAEVVQPRSLLRAPTPAPRDLTAQSLMARFVSLGTSNSQGVQSAGISALGQRATWPAQLALRAAVPYDIPLIQNPGCNPPLMPPLAVNLVLVAAFGDDLVSAVMTTCAPLLTGVTLPGSNLAISGANAWDALHSTIESVEHPSDRKAELYSRVLRPGQTQVTAMLAKQPTFVSVELAANEVLPASTGRTAAMTPFAEWQPVYDSILGAVKSTGAGAVLVGLPNNAANFPSIRRAREFFNEWPALLTLGITVSINCYFSSNHLFIPGYLLTLVSKTPTTATCANVPGAVDYVLTASDINTINARLAQMNTRISAKAAENGYAYFSLEAVYGLPKPKLSVLDLLFSNNPFGPNISLDGVHPSAAGQAILATAAAQAISVKYGVTIP